MGYLNREIELKARVTSGQSYTKLLHAAERFLEAYYPEYETVSAKASDYYWEAPSGSAVDFIRLRKRDSGTGGIITVKSTDKSSNLDRVEIDVDIDDFRQGLALLTSLYGKYKEKVTKKYHVLFLENEHTNFSIYQVEKDSNIFMEVEARSGNRVAELLLAFSEFNPDFALESVQSSIYDMFVLKRAPKINTISDAISMIKGRKGN